MKANAPEKIWMDSEWIPHFDCKDCITEDSVEYTCTDAFIEKAKKWFEMYTEWRDLEGNRHCDMKSFEDFVNYIKGE